MWLSERYRTSPFFFAVDYEIALKDLFSAGPDGSAFLLQAQKVLASFTAKLAKASAKVARDLYAIAANLFLRS